MAKRPSDAKAGFRARPSDWSGGKIKPNWSAAGMRRIATGIRASAAERQKEREEMATRQILGFFRPGWPGFNPKEMASRTAIARALQRNGIVTALTSEPAILPLLVKLEKQGKIALPPRTIVGGARKKKDSGTEKDI